MVANIGDNYTPRMLLERGARAALHDFSTLFLLAASILVPLHLIYAIVFRDVITVHELHAQISGFSALRQVHNVGATDLIAFRIVGAVLIAIEFALVPLATRAAGRVMELEDAGGTATVWDAWRHAGDRDTGVPWSTVARGPLIVAAAYTIALAWLLEKTCLRLVGLVPEERLFALFGLSQGVARAAAAPFLLATCVMLARMPKGRSGFTPNLY